MRRRETAAKRRIVRLTIRAAVAVVGMKSRR